MQKNIYFYLILVLSCFLNTVVISQNVVEGFVYSDLNRNSVKDDNEPGISQVPVSNGREVVLTDEQGRYVLPVTNDDIIFVIKPAGYAVPVNELMLPQFYYIHKPLGSPELEYKGVEPTGHLPESVDFPLYKKEDTEKFKVILFGDPQVRNKRQIGFFEDRIVSELYNASSYDFGITLGDLVANNPNLFEPYSEVVGKIGIPWHNVIGNHDMNFDIDADSLSDESFERVYGPTTYSFNVGKTNFIILKNMIRPDPRNNNNRSYWGGFTEKQFTFIENYLKFVPKDHLVVLAFHVPIWEDYVDRDIFRDEDRVKLFSLLEDFPHTFSISAHSHIQNNKLMTSEDDWHQIEPHHHFNIGTTSASWYRGELDSDGLPIAVMADGTPQGYAIMEIDGNNYNIKYKAAGYDDAYQMNIYHPKVIGKSGNTLDRLYVNFFIGSENDEVMYKINDGDWKRMNYSIEFDPNYLKILQKWDCTETVIPGNRPADARQNSHLWKAPLPANLKVGQHKIEVRAKDMFGNVYYDESFYRIDEP